eukprot:ctg_3227.g418
MCLPTCPALRGAMCRSARAAAPAVESAHAAAADDPQGRTAPIVRHQFHLQRGVHGESGVRTGQLATAHVSGDVRGAGPVSVLHHHHHQQQQQHDIHHGIRGGVAGALLGQHRYHLPAGGVVSAASLPGDGAVVQIGLAGHHSTGVLHHAGGGGECVRQHWHPDGDRQGPQVRRGEHLGRGGAHPHRDVLDVYGAVLVCAAG